MSYESGLTISCSTGIKTESTLTAGEIADRNATAADVVNQESVPHFGEIVAGYARGSIFRGGAAYWEVYSAKTNHFILVGDGTDIVSKAFDWDDMAAGAGADMVHDHSAANEGGQLDWDNIWSDAVHSHGSNAEGGKLAWGTVWSDAVHSHANAGEGGQLDWDNVWSDAVHDHSAAGEGGTLDWDTCWADAVHTHGSAAEGGVTLGPLNSITMADDAWIGIGAALERIVFDAAGDICIMGANFGVNTPTPSAPLDVEIAGAAAHQDFIRMSGGFGGASQDHYRSIDWHDFTNTMGAIGLVYDGAKANMHWHSFYNGAYKGEANAIMTLLGNGRLGINNVTPDRALAVYDDIASVTAAIFKNDGNATTRWGIEVWYGEDAPAGTNYCLIGKDGDGTDDGGLRSIAGAFAVYNLSDRALKMDIVDTKVKGCEVIGQLKVRDFKYKRNPGTEHCGFIAQEMAECVPNMVAKAPGSDMLATSETLLIPYITKAIQELDVRLTQGGL